MTDVAHVDETAARHRHLHRPRWCYLEIPALDPQRSAAFYARAFGWEIQGRDSGRPTFTYPGAEVTGAFVAGRKPAREPGLLAYVWVDDIAATLARIRDAGGETVDAPKRPGGNLTIATFRDPAGNVIGLYEEDPPA